MLNLNNVKTPGVYLSEIPAFPPSIVPVATAIPVFIGHTQTNPNPASNPLAPVEINSLDEFVALFGSIDHAADFSVDVIAVVEGGTVNEIVSTTLNVTNEASVYTYNMYHALRLFYENGGGRCFVISVGLHQVDATTGAKTLQTGATVYTDALQALEAEDDPTLIVFPELIYTISAGPPINAATYEAVYTAALNQAEARKDRFVLIDVPQLATGTPAQIASADLDEFRSNISDFGFDTRKFGAAYYPYLTTAVDAATLSTNASGEIQIAVNVFEIAPGDPLPDTSTATPTNTTVLNGLRSDNNYAGVYAQIVGELSSLPFQMPPSPAMAGVYANVDNQRGVFKAPANVTVASIIAPTLKIDDAIQDNMNVHTSGKAVNAIRTIPNRGLVVWGARTLDGNSQDWRYVSVRRFFNFVEESVQEAMYPFVFEPNTANTWSSIRAAIENFLTVQWGLGALQGAKPSDAFFVRIGLGETMTPNDILEGRLIARIGMAVVRPAEFIILEFTQILPQS